MHAMWYDLVRFKPLVQLKQQQLAAAANAPNGAHPLPPCRGGRKRAQKGAVLGAFNAPRDATRMPRKRLNEVSDLRTW